MCMHMHASTVHKYGREDVRAGIMAPRNRYARCGAEAYPFRREFALISLCLRLLASKLYREVEYRTHVADDSDLHRAVWLLAAELFVHLIHAANRAPIQCHNPVTTANSSGSRGTI